MNVYCRGIATIRHKVTGEIYSIESDELDWDRVGADERQMGPEFQYQATVDHPELGTLTWSLWEYPVGAENYNETNTGGHELIEDFEYGLAHVPDEDVDDWVSYPPPTHPFSVYMTSYLQTSSFLAQHGSHDGTSLINRMLFSHQITALEAYLCDTLINSVMADKEAMKRLMIKDKDLAEKKFGLATIAEDPALVSKELNKYLRSVQYHNLPKVDFLYKTALQVKVLDLCGDKDKLFNAVSLRHDCVHRNGFDKDGKELGVFTKQFVQETADQIRHFVEQIQNAVMAT